jgi:CheY-like chemotaxis protein
MSTDTVFLYVEDDPMSRDIMQTLLKRVMGFPHLFVFENSESFAERLSDLPARPNIIFLDIHVKPKDGFALLELIRAQEVYRESRVIAITASVMNEEVARLKTAGFDGGIGKPLSMETFPDLVTHILAGESVWHVS